MRILTLVVGLCGALLTLAGAAGAHLVAAGTDPLSAAQGDPEWAFPANRWNNALLYGFVHILAALAITRRPASWPALAAGWAFVGGVVMFSGVQMADLLWAGMAADGGNASGDRATPFDGLGFLVPFGGIAFVVGWVGVAVGAFLRGPRPD